MSPERIGRALEGGQAARASPTATGPVPLPELALATPAAPAAGRWLRLALALGLSALVLIAFAPALGASFVNWDDSSAILEVEEFRGLDGAHLRWMFTSVHMGPYQPLAWLSLAVDHALYGLGEGLDAPQAPGFHRTSVLLHLAGALAVWRTAALVLRRAVAAAPARLELAAALAALVYAVHPLRAESVAWVTERRDVLCALFYAAAAHAYLRAAPRRPAERVSLRAALAAGAFASAAALVFAPSVAVEPPGTLVPRGPGTLGVALALGCVLASFAVAARAAGLDRARAAWLAAALAAFALALLSKGLAMVLPLVLLVADVWPLRRMSSRAGAASALVEKLPFLALAAIAATLAMRGQRALPEAVVPLEAHSLGERVLQAFYGLSFYPSRTLAPSGLSPIYELPDDLRASEPRFLVAILAVLFTAAACWRWRRRLPALAACAAAFALAIAPVLGFTQAGPQLVADRYSLLACLPFAFLAGGAWLAWVERRPGQRAIAWSAAALVAVGLVLATRRQVAVWRDSDTLWNHALAVRPRDALPHGQLGSLSFHRSTRARDPAERRELLERALAHFEQEQRLDPTPIPNDLLNHGSTYLALARPAEAEPLLRRAVAARPTYHLGYANLGAALAGQERHDEARAALLRCVELDPTYARAWYQLGRVEDARGEREAARSALRRALELAPRFEAARRKLEELGG
jgi:tetratricopeptide (TPR) repeat protein